MVVRLLCHGSNGVAKYMTREEAAFPSRRPSCSSQRIPTIVIPLLSSSTQRRTCPALYLVGAAWRTTARVVVCDPGGGGDGFGGACFLGGGDSSGALEVGFVTPLRPLREWESAPPRRRSMGTYKLICTTEREKWTLGSRKNKNLKTVTTRK